jgi:hypothetical protein
MLPFCKVIFFKNISVPFSVHFLPPTRPRLIKARKPVWDAGLIGSDPIEPSVLELSYHGYFMFPRGEEWERGFNSVANSGVVAPGILAVGVSVNWETPPGASGGRVLSTFLPLLDLPAVGNNPFFVLPAYYLRNIAKTLSMPYGGRKSSRQDPSLLCKRGEVWCLSFT